LLYIKITYSNPVFLLGEKALKIAFVLPAIGKKPGKKYIGTWKMEPLTIALLKALTPPPVHDRVF